MRRRLTPVFRSRVEELKRSIIDTISVLTQQNYDRGEKVHLDDHRGSLIVNQINDQESEVIQCLERTAQNEIVAWSGIYDEEIQNGLEDFEIPKLINILDALEAAIENQ